MKEASSSSSTTSRPEQVRVDYQVDIPGVVSGIAYGTSMFLAGCIMGTIRELLVVPLVGEEIAVYMEIPVMLLICWMISQQIDISYYLLECCAWRDGYTDVNTIGVTAFVTMVLLETFLSMAIFHQSLEEIQDNMGTPQGRIGFAALLLASTFPTLQLPRDELDEDILMNE